MSTRRRRRRRLQIGLFRLRHPLRWRTLDVLADTELMSQRLTEVWRQYARHQSGEQLWYANYLAALCEQCTRDISEVWLAVHRGDQAAADTANARWDVTLAAMQQAHTELHTLVPVPA